MPISPARSAAFDILLRVEERDAYASELLHSQRLEKLSPADRALATELVMGVLRWRSRLDESIAAASNRSLNKLDVEVLNALRLSAYQLRHLNRIPAHAAIDDGVELVKRARKRSAAAFTNAVLRRIATADVEVPSTGIEWTPALLASELAQPPWLVERWASAYGIERTFLICSQNQRIPNTIIRLDSPEVAAELAAEGIELAPGALLDSARIVVGGDIARTRALQEGRVFIQDEASQLVAALVGAGSRLLDCCAAPGGKTAALAWRNPTAEIIAAELHAHRANLLRKRVRAANVQVIQADALNLPDLGAFDRVLADVPCSGTGTLARNPEIKWRLRPEDLNELHGRQVGILRAALGPLAPGGRAVYSTCSLEREENESVTDEVLRGTQGVRLLDCREELERLRSSGELVWSDLDSLLSGKFLRTIPGVHPCDGFFVALIQKQ
ncbi:MAG: 16S rRNA (cytosine(967)-C(5))-methyltransferase RsmB [Candidatus Korobacteraceae bacterium]